MKTILSRGSSSLLLILTSCSSLPFSTSEGPRCPLVTATTQKYPSSSLNGAPRSIRRELEMTFDCVQTHEPERIWASELPKNVIQAKEDFENRKRLPNQKTYGAVARSYTLEDKTAKEIDSDMKHLGCKKESAWILKYPENKPIIYQGKKLPLISYLCSDGSVVRIKPQGDATSPYRPQPHGSIALRYPYDSQYRNFDDEVSKVDNEGNLLPKSPRELKDKTLVNEWAEDAHTDLEI